MARLARIVVPTIPHHVTQRGNRRADVFFGPDDYRAYMALLAEAARKAETQVWAYCLMPNHVHLIVVPSHEDGLRAALGEAHRRYTRHINFRQGWRGHLWQERFHSFPMDEDYLLTCARYVELNPLGAGLARRPENWGRSSARARLKGREDGVVKVAALLDRMPDWRTFLAGGLDETVMEAIRSHGRTGHPLGSAEFFDKLEAILGRNVRPHNQGGQEKPETLCNYILSLFILCPYLSF